MSRRVFLADLGRGAAAIAILGVAGCAPAGTSSTPGGASATPGGSSLAPGGSSRSPVGGESTAWHRVNLGFVSAYVLVRGGEAAVVDTGVGGSEGAIEQVLTAAGVRWEDVGHVVLTHKHGDHIGSVEAVLSRAASAQGYAGAADLPAIQAPRPLTVVGDGDEVFGLAIVATPGHTLGHISVHDPVGGIFVAGDALTTNGGAVAPPGAQFTEDMSLAMASIAQIGALTFETLLVGHGDPIESGASRLVAELAAGN